MNSDKIFKKFQDLLQVEIDLEGNGYNHDIEIGPWQTADGYDVWVMAEDTRHINWESEVFYYQPDHDAVIKYIQDGASVGSFQTIYFPEFYDIFDDYTMLEFIEENWDDDEQTYDEFLDLVE